MSSPATQDERRIALFVPSLMGGGAERVMVTLATEFSRLGRSVDLVAGSGTGPCLSQAPDSVRVVDLGAKRTAAALIPLASYLRRERPAALLSTPAHANIVALPARRLAAVPTRVVIREATLMEISIRNAPQRRSRWIPTLARRLYPWADEIIAVSHGVADDLARVLKLPRERIRVIHNPVVTDQLYQKAREAPDHPWFAAGAPPVVLGVGRLDPEKDFALLIRAFSILEKTRRVRLVVLGAGPERNALNSLIQELGISAGVELPGFVENPFSYMARCAVLALTSWFEGLPNVLIEAMACGTPVVAVDCPSGPREILEGGRYGRLAPVGDAKALAHAIEETLDHPPQPETLRSAVMRFSADAVAKDYLEVLLG